MPDIFSVAQRSAIMRAVKSRGNKSTELELIKLFKIHHIIGWRRNYKLFGHPDFVFVHKRIAVFCDGCFWHGHDCRNVIPDDNFEYWQRKIQRNKQRDNETTLSLMQKGWIVVRIWECEIKKSDLSKFLPLFSEEKVQD
jgi:DNA mismatch endonuclease (patch repair protein)